VAARDLEESVVRWLSAPPEGQLPVFLVERLRHLMSAWSMLWPVNRRRLLQAMIEELRWDGTTSTFTIVLDEDWIVKGHEQENGGEQDS
jgi:hypothetical protein